VTLNETYKIDFVNMRQVRRDDSSRWRAVKRGGSADDPLPNPDGDDDDEEEEEAAAASKPAPKPAAAAPPADEPKKLARKKTVDRKAKGKKEDEDEGTVAAASPEPSAAAYTSPVSAAPSSASAAVAPASSSTAAAPKDDSALLRQLADIESELDESHKQLKSLREEFNRAKEEHKRSLGEMEKKRTNDVTKIQKEKAELESALDQERAATKQAKAAADQAQVETRKALESARKAQQDASDARSEMDRLSKSLAASDANVRALEARLSSSAAESSRIHSAMEKLVDAIKPIAAAFGIDARSPIGRAITQWERDKMERERTGGAGAAANDEHMDDTAPSGAASASASSPRKRGRGHDDDDDDAGKSDSKPPIDKRSRTLAPPPAAIAADAVDATIPAPSLDDDATQAMVAPIKDDDNMSDVEAATAPTSPAPSSSAAAAAAAARKVKSPAPFLTQPTQLRPTLISFHPKPAPLCFAPVSLDSSTTHALQLSVNDDGDNAQLSLVGCRDGHIELMELNGSTGEWCFRPMSIEGRPKHKFAKPPSKASSEDGEDYSQAGHVHALLALPVERSDSSDDEASFLVAAGEGRLLRWYMLRVGAKHASLKWIDEVDVQGGSWITCMTKVRAPTSAGADVASKLFVGVGVSGVNHCANLYEVNLTSVVTASGRPPLRFSVASGSEEVRSLTQLSDGRLVIAGCSFVLENATAAQKRAAGATAADALEGGSIEVVTWKTTQEPPQKALLKHDVHVLSSIGLRCNGVSVIPASGSDSGDKLLAAFEYCFTGHRRLVLFSFASGAGSMDISSVDIESKHLPSQDENTFTAVQVASRPHENKAALMTYGGRMLLYDLEAKKKIGTLNAHGETIVEDGPSCFIAPAPSSGSWPLLLSSGGNAEVKIWTTAKTR